MEVSDMDFSKVLAILAQPRKPLEPLRNVDIRRLDVSFMGKDQSVHTRPICLYLPKNAIYPVPLVYIAHYEMHEDTPELRNYLSKDFAVATPTDFRDEYNGQLVNDDLMFNNAAYVMLRELPEIDKSRIAVIGGSAGGYMALMLNCLQLGICCSVSNSPITNLYFNFYHGSKYKTKHDDKTAEPHIPLLSRVYELFMSNLNDFPEPSDMERWETFSPVALTELLGNPIMINHYTSDLLVPIDQVTKRYTYERPGKSLPEDYPLRLPHIDGKLGMSLEERLPCDETRVLLIPEQCAEQDGYIYPFSTEHRFSINVYDQGPVESYAGHKIITAPQKLIDDTAFLEAMFSRTAGITCELSTEKLIMLLDIYMGRCKQLLVFVTAPCDVYGSLTSYQNEVCAELYDWIADHGEDAFRHVADNAIDLVLGSDKHIYMAAINEVIHRLSLSDD